MTFDEAPDYPGKSEEDRVRHEALNRLTEEVQAKGFYDIDYPEETEGSRIARDARVIGNKLTDAERQEHFRHGWRIIHGEDSGEQCRQS